jgi:TRAP-type C4-dicarboxylate transport system permease small subunit
MIIIEIILKFLKRLKDSNIFEIIVEIQLAVLCVVVIIQVLFRYLLNFPIAWSDEAARFLLIWVALLGSAIAIKQKINFSINLFVKKFSEKVQNNLQFYTNIFLFILIFDVMVLKGVYLINMSSLQISPALHLRMSYVYSAVLVSGILSCCYILEEILLFIRENMIKNIGKEIKSK